MPVLSWMGQTSVMPEQTSAGRGLFLSRRRRLGIETVKVFHNAGTDTEEMLEVEAHIQPGAGFFNVDAPIFEGDIVEVADPRRGSGGVERRMAKEVKVHSNGPASMQHTEVIWGKAPTPRVPPVRRLTFENLHPAVQAAAGDLFADGHYEQSVSEAFKSIEVRVKALTGLDKSGAPLMGDAFGTADPLIDTAVHDGQTGKDEREGFLALFRGAMIGIRNPRAHELFAPGDPQQALEYLAFASLLHRRLDTSTVRNS